MKQKSVQETEHYLQHYNQLKDLNVSPQLLF